jgi:hypothetical protein
MRRFFGDWRVSSQPPHSIKEKKMTSPGFARAAKLVDLQGQQPDSRPMFAPMVLRSAIVLSLIGLAGGCGGGGPSGSGGGAQPGTVKGAAMDTQNRPLAGAQIDVCSSIFYETCMSGSTASDGSYSFALASNDVWRAYGSITKSYQGATYCLPLAIDNDNTFHSSEAAIRNFSWKLTGVIPGSHADNYASSYFGARLDVVYDIFALDHSRIRINFVPSGPLIDGSVGNPFTALVGDWASDGIGNIPIGVYTVSADYLQTGGAAPLRVSTSSTSSGLSAAARVQFPPDGTSCLIGPTARLYVAP